MIVDGPIPERVLTLAAAATIFCVMLTLGLGIEVREVRRVGGNPGLVAVDVAPVLVGADWRVVLGRKPVSEQGLLMGTRRPCAVRCAGIVAGFASTRSRDSTT